jgi:hypothetical protein
MKSNSMIEVFKTNVKNKAQAIKIIKILKGNFGYEKVNFDLQDSDRILRIEAPSVLPHCVIGILKTERLECELLND